MSSKTCGGDHRRARARRRAANNNDRRRRTGRWYVDIAEVRPHVLDLHADMTIRAIAAAARVAPRTVARIVYEPDAKRVHSAVAAALLDVVKTPVLRSDMRLSIGSCRRLRAMAVVGLTLEQAAQRTGYSRHALGKIAAHRHLNIFHPVADAIAALYAQVCAELLANWPEPMIPAADSRARSRARNRAVAAGWHGPLAWDDDTIDDPDAWPNTHGLDMTTDEPVTSDVAAALAGRRRHTDLSSADRATVCRILVAHGRTDQEIGELLHWPYTPSTRPGSHSAVQTFRCRNKIRRWGEESLSTQAGLEPQPA